jgi:hypothetical protein
MLKKRKTHSRGTPDKSLLGRGRRSSRNSAAVVPQAIAHAGSCRAPFLAERL